MIKPNWCEKKFNVLFISIMFIWTISLFLAPLFTSSDTIRGLDGHSTIIDYNDKWDNLSAYPKTIYLLGDILCHQKDSRSFIINGNQMPVCSRCLAVYIGLLIGAIFTLFIPNNVGSKKYLLYTLPKKIRERSIKKIGLEFLPIMIIALFLLPVAIDGVLQLFTGYESSHILRIITGIPTGWIGGLVLGALINT